MKTVNNTPNSPLITNPHDIMRPSSEKKGFINSIRKINILSSIKNYILRKFHSNTAKNPPISSTEVYLISKNCEKTKLAAKKIEQENIKAINYCKELTDDQKMNYLQLNQLGSAILNHPNYSETIGLFRRPGNALERDKLISHLLAGKSLKEYFLNKDIVDIKILTSAYTKIAAKLIEENIHSLETIPESIHKLAEAVQNKSASSEGPSAQTSINQDEKEQLKERDPDVLDKFFSLEKTPLTLQLVIPLFVEITKNQQINKMDAYNLATCFAPRLNANSALTAAFPTELISDAQIYLETLINHDLKLQSYDI
ncbi:RhoGAP domain-containing protein [Providencia rettgeri]